MATVSFNGDSYSCDKAIKGSDYIHLLDASGMLVASFEGIVDFSAFTISDGAWTDAVAADECNLVTIGEDGMLHRGTYKGSDIVPISWGTSDLTAGSSALPTGTMYLVYE